MILWFAQDVEEDRRRVRLPAAEAGILPVPASRRTRDRVTILVAEDEIITRSTLAQFLRAAGHAVIEANSADEAAAVLHSTQRVDLVITDLEMPGRLDGVDLIRSEEHTSELQSLMRISYAVFCLKKKKKH